MGKVFLNNSEVGTFTPDVEGTLGDVNLDSIDVGDFTLKQEGYVYLDSVIVGTYVAQFISSLQDPRYRTKVFLDTYLNNAALTKDDDSTQVTFIVAYGKAPYPLSSVFIGKSVDLIFSIATPTTTALPMSVGYEEHVPVSAWCVDKTGITGTKLRWKAERELRKVIKYYPTGSLRVYESTIDNDQNLGSTLILYSVTCDMCYTRFS